MISFDAIVVLLVLLFILVSFYKEVVGPAMTFFIAVVILGVFGILTPAEILSGFANEQIAVVIMLLLLGEIIRQTSVLDVIFDKLFFRANGYKSFMARMMIMVGSMSAFFNNTPLVAVMMPYVDRWCKRNNVSPSKLLMPLSYAAIMGGCVTLIGTSTNLIVNGMVEDQQIFPELKSLEIFDFFLAGFPMLVIGILYMLTIGNSLMREENRSVVRKKAEPRSYLVETMIRSNSQFVGQSLKESGLLGIKGIKIKKITNCKQSAKLISQDHWVFEEGDVLRIIAEPHILAEMVKPSAGLTITSVGMLSHLKHKEVLEVVVSHNSTLIEKTVHESNMRGKYGAAILGIHRNGTTIQSQLDKIKLRAGDVLLLLTGEDFQELVKGDHDFYQISKVKEWTKPEAYKIFLLLGGTLLSIILSALKIIPLFSGLLFVLVMVSILRVVFPKDIPKLIDLNLAVIIALSLALGTAMIKSGVAAMIADAIVNLFMPYGTVTLLFGIYFITSILAAYITNKAAVAILFPIALMAAKMMALPPKPFILTVAFAAAANFMTPIGYQTNLMVYGPGGYSFKDFFRVGAPLTFIYMIVTVWVLSYAYL